MEQARVAKLSAPASGNGTPTSTSEHKKVVRKRGAVTAAANSHRLRFPMEDTDLPTYAPRKGPSVQYPEITYTFPGIPSESVESLIQSYAFFISFPNQLQLRVFTFDDFVSALTSPTRSPLLLEIFGTCIWHACTIARQPNPIGADDVPGNEIYKDLDPTERFVTRYFNIFSVCIEQWFKWFPGRWATGYEGQRNPVHPHSTRMKAWEIALVGFVRGEDDLKIRDSLLAMLLGDNDGMDDDEEAEIQEDEDEPVDDEIVTRKGRSAANEDIFDGSDLSDVEETQSVKAKKAAPVAKGGIMAEDSLDALVVKTRKNFMLVSVEDRIELLRYIIENVLLEMNIIGSHIDKSIDEVAKMKLEIREVVRERRQMYDYEYNIPVKLVERTCSRPNVRMRLMLG